MDGSISKFGRDCNEESTAYFVHEIGGALVDEVRRVAHGMRGGSDTCPDFGLSGGGERGASEPGSQSLAIPMQPLLLSHVIKERCVLRQAKPVCQVAANLIRHLRTCREAAEMLPRLEHDSQ